MRTIFIGAFFILFLIKTNTTQAQCLKNDSLELIKLYKATNGANWANKWDLSKPVNTWYRVGLTSSGCNVETVRLARNRLTGSIPDLHLPELENLFLHNNQLNGSISNLDFPKLSSLSLSSNQLSGEVPNFDHLPSLRLLDVTNNYFTFKDIEFNLNDINKRIRFNPQHFIHIYKSEEPVLYVKTGGDVHNNTYTWYKNDEEHKTIVGDSTLIVNLPGVYYCKIVNNALSQGSYSSNFILQSNSTFVSISDLVANRLTRGIPPPRERNNSFPKPCERTCFHCCRRDKWKTP